MTTVTFDTHAFIKKLTESGFTEQQAEAITDLQKETVKTAMEQARHDYELDDLVTNKTLDSRIRESELKNEVKLAETKSELIRWVVGVGLLQTALITALLMKLSTALT